MAGKFATIDEYAQAQPDATRAVVEELRRRAHRAAPDAVEAIAYDMPTFKLDGRSVIHFAAWKSYVSVYPAPGGDPDLNHELEPYLAAKGTRGNALLGATCGIAVPLRTAIPHDHEAQY